MPAHIPEMIYTEKAWHGVEYPELPDPFADQRFDGAEWHYGIVRADGFVDCAHGDARGSQFDIDVHYGEVHFIGPFRRGGIGICVNTFGRTEKPTYPHVPNRAEKRKAARTARKKNR